MTTQADRLVSEAHAVTASLLRCIEDAQARAHAFVQKLVGAGGVDVIATYDWEATDLTQQEFVDAMVVLQTNLPAILDTETRDKLYVLETKL